MKTIEPTTAHLRMLSSVRDELWLMPSDRIEGFALSCLDAIEKTAMQISLEDLFDARQTAYVDELGIAHIQIKEALLNKAPAIYEKLGLATRYNTIVAETRQCVAAGAKGIVYHVDSPGGTVSGVVEAGDAIASAGVPTIAYVSGMACSAAYWLASQTGGIVAAPSANVGNIGAILSWADCSGFWKDMGVEWKALTNEGASLKSTFHTEPNEEQIEFLQDSINEAGEAFHDAVITGRGKAGAELDDEIWKAGWYSGKKAGNLGLIDEIGGVESALNEIIARI